MVEMVKINVEIYFFYIKIRMFCCKGLRIFDPYKNGLKACKVTVIIPGRLNSESHFL